MKKLLFAGIAVSMLAACSQDEVVPVNNPSNAIKFSTTTENSTRANEIYCNDKPFTQFNVYAAYDGLKYIDNDVIDNEDGTGWKNLSGLRYWPNSGEVTFYGYRNGTLTWDATAPQFVGFSPADEISEQKDLMYSRKAQAKPASGGEVKLNFRHALSQIVFNAINTNPNLYVEIEEVAIAKVHGTGTYTFPTVDSEDNIGHPSTSENDYVKAGRGSWELGENNTNAKTYRVGVWDNLVKLYGVKNNTNKEALTTYTNESDFSKAMLLLPQDEENFTASTDKKLNPHFLVKCRVYNVAEVPGEITETTDLTSNVCLWGKKGDDGKYVAQDIMIPFTPKWEEGKKYTYTFKFGEGNGGVNPDNPDEPVLVAISFDVDIDEFVPVDDENVEVDVPEANK